MVTSRNIIIPALSILTMLALLLISIQNSIATPSLMTRYVAIDNINRTSYVFDENFVALPDNPLIPNTSIETLPSDKILWLIGTTIDVIRRNENGSIDVVSNEPAYSEMVHHMVWGYKSENRIRDYKCGIARPIASGSELTNIEFPKGYAYKLHGGVLMPIAWHWENPNSIPVTEKIYLRFNISIDDAPLAYKDVNIDWIDTVTCKSAFIVPPGEFEITGPLHAVATTRKIVAVFPHIHDHSKKIKLKSTSNTIRKFKAENQKISVAHDDMGQGPTLWHEDKNHLPVNGLYSWLPGKYGPIITAGESLWIESEFDNPHPRNIDNMAIAVIMWVPVSN